MPKEGYLKWETSTDIITFKPKRRHKDHPISILLKEIILNMHNPYTVKIWLALTQQTPPENGVTFTPSLMNFSLNYTDP